MKAFLTLIFSNLLSIVLYAQDADSTNTNNSVIVELVLISAGVLILYLLTKRLINKGLTKKVAISFGSRRFKKRTNIILSLFVLFIILMGALSTEFIKSKMNSNTEFQLAQSLESTKQKIEFWADKRKGQIQSFIQSPDIQSALTSSREKDTLLVSSKNTKYQNDFIITQEGDILHLQGSKLGNLSDCSEQFKKCVESAFKGKENYCSQFNSIGIDFIDNWYTESPQVSYIFYPITLGKEIKAVYFGVFFSRNELSELLEFSRVGATGEAYLVNKEGFMVTQSRFTNDLLDLDYFEMDKSGNPVIHLHNPGVNIMEGNFPKNPEELKLTYSADNVIKEKRGVNVEGYSDYRGVDVQGAWTWLDNYNLGLITEIDKDESLSVFYFIREAAMMVLAITILIILISLTFTLSLGEKANEVLIKAKEDLELEVLKRTSDLRLQTAALDAAANAIFITDTEGTISWLNQATINLTGYSREELIGQNPKIFKSGQHNQKFYEELWSTIKNGDVWHGTLVNKRKNKELYHEEMTIAPVRSDSGEVTNFVAVKMDITDRIRSEKEVHEERKRFKQLLDSTPDAIVIIDDEGTIQIVNSQMLDLFGYERNEIIGQKVEVLMSPELADKHLEHRGSFFASPKSRNMGSLSDLYAYHKDGSRFPVEISLNPIETGDDILVAASIRDVTTRKQAEEAIRASEAKFRSITATASDAIISANHEGTIESWNNAAETIFGYTEKEAVGQTLELIIPEKYRDAHLKGMIRVLSGGKRNAIDKTLELEGRKKEGEIIPIELSLSSWDSEGEMQFSAIIRDISERKRFENLLKESEQRLKFAIEGSNDGLWDWNVKTGKVFLSPRFETMLGYEPGTLQLSYDSMKDIVHEDDLAIMLETMRNHYEGKTDQYELEYRIKNASNDYIWILSKGKMVEFDEDHHPIRFVGIHSDISHRKALEAQVVKSEEQLKAALEGSNDGVFDINYSTGEMYVSPLFETMLGYDIGELQKTCDSQLLFDLVHEQDFDNLESALEKHLGGESNSFNCEYRLRMKNGSYKWIAARAKIVGQDTDGVEEIRLVGTHSDIQRRKELEIQLEQANIRMSGELNVAKDIQMSMLPLTFPAFPKRKDIDIFADLIPAREVGGDFYDFHFIDENHLYFVVGDVSGKGVPAALMMAVCKTLLKSKAGNDMSTASIMTQVNNEMALENTNFMFVTVFLGILNTNTGELTYTNAGHNPSYIKKSNGTIEKLGELHGPVVAAMEGLTYGESKTLLKTSEFIFAYTDGVPEAHNKQEELYGNERMEDFLNTNNFHSPQRVIEDIIISVRDFENGAEKFDDLTALCVEFHGGNGDSVKRELIELSNQIENVQKAIQRFEEFSLTNHIPMAISMKISIVLDELLANVVNYAFDDNAEHEIYVEFKVSGDKLIIVIEDDGKPFNPFSQNPPDTKLSINERAIGGLGIHLVKNLMDECIYSRTSNRNVVTLTKYKLSENS